MIKGLEQASSSKTSKADNSSKSSKGKVVSVTFNEAKDEYTIVVCGARNEQGEPYAYPASSGKSLIRCNMTHKFKQGPHEFKLIGNIIVPL